MTTTKCAAKTLAGVSAMYAASEPVARKVKAQKAAAVEFGCHAHCKTTKHGRVPDRPNHVQAPVPDLVAFVRDSRRSSQTSGLIGARYLKSPPSMHRRMPRQITQPRSPR
jgi:hypothetical protein